MVVLLFVTFTNCTEDGVFVTEALEHSNTPNFRISNINSKAVLSNDLVSKSLSRFRSKGESMSTNKIIHNSDYGFSIDTDHVKYLENTVTGAHSYNFKITRDTPQTDAVENLVLMSTTVGGYKAYIVNYNLTGEEIDNANEAQMLANTSVYTPIDFDLDAFDPTAAKLTNELVCVEYYEWGSIPNDEGNLNGDTPLFTYGWIQTGQDCFWVYGGGDGDDGSGDGGFSSGPSGNGGGGGYSNNGNNYSDPTYDPSDPDIHGNGGIISVPNDDDPPCEEPSEDLLNQLTTAFGEGNFTLTSNCGTSSGENELPEFDSITEIEAYIESFNNGSFLANTTLLDPSEIQTDIRIDTYPMEYMNFPQGTLIADLIVKLPNDTNGLDHIEVQNAKVTFDGNNTLFDWNFDETYAGNGYQVVINESIDSYRVHMRGVMEYGIFAFGGGLKIKKQIEVIIKYSLASGDMDLNWSRWVHLN